MKVINLIQLISIYLNLQCKRITIEYKTKFWVFDCSNPISKLDNPDVDLVLSGQQRYTVTVKTKTSSGIFPIFIKMKGTKGMGNKKVFYYFYNSLDAY